MALDFFRIERGLLLDELVSYLQGAGVPGLTADTDGADVGSVYTNTADGALYTKIATGTGADKWQKMASEAYVNNAIGATISWREPAVVRDNVATTVPSGTATQPITVDGVSVTNGQRVLFSAIVGGNGKNVYVYNQATGLFVEDINAETNGDALFVIGGTSAGKTYVYNGADWVLTDQSSLDELGFIRAFIGKSGAGNVVPTYTSTNFVAQSSNLQTSVSALDAELGANVALGNFVNPTFTVNGNIQALDTEIGANVTSGGFILASNSVNQNLQVIDTHLGVNFLAGNVISLNQTVSGAVTALDAKIGPDVVTSNYLTAGQTLTASLSAINTGLGANVTTGGTILSTNSINQNVQALDAALTQTTMATTVNNITSVQTVDSVTAGSAKWLVRVSLVSDPTAVYATEVYALCDGALNVDFTRYATLRLGAAISGLAVTADSDGTTAGLIRLRVAATGAVNVTARRVGVIV
jgi:hypothetical protein